MMKLRIAIVTLQGKDALVKEKERVEDILIKTINKDRISIIYKGRQFEIAKQ